jgi:biopolymer transport protein TolQ
MLLLSASITSWTYIFRKMFTIRAARVQTEEFERVFWSGGNLRRCTRMPCPAAARPARRRAGAHLPGRHGRIHQGQGIGSRRGGAVDPALLDGARRAMRAAYQREMDALESHLAFLASVGSVSPYVGLFGTVWGIMNAFRGLANVQQATLAAVAPGIAEALIATAIGLFAAIPAVVAYNRFSHDIDRLAIRFELHRRVLQHLATSGTLMAGSSMRGGRPRKFKSEINVVPYIDVMLVLLIIFMVATPSPTPA